MNTPANRPGELRAAVMARKAQEAINQALTSGRGLAIGMSMALAPMPLPSVVDYPEGLQMTDQERRIPPLPREEWTDEARDVFAALGEPNARENGSRADIVMVLANHPAMGKSFLDWSKHPLRANTLPLRSLELLILRIAWRTKSQYEWHNHARYALGAGLTLEDLAAVRDYPEQADRWLEEDRLILQSVDELMDENRISDETWDALGKHFDTRQKMDVVMTSGSYITTAWAISSFDVRLEDDVDVIGFDLKTKSGKPPEPRAK